MCEVLWTIGWYFVVFWVVLLGIVFGLGMPIVVVRRLLGKKKDYWPDTEDVLIGMGLLIVCFGFWVSRSHWAVP